MSDLLNQLGISVSLLLSQGVNFLIILGALTILVYKPLLRVMQERRVRIEFGLRGAEEAERALKSIEETKARVLAEAEIEALKKIEVAEERGHDRHDAIVADASSHAEKILREAEEIAEQRRMGDLDRVRRESAGLLRHALAKAVSLNPEQVDEALIRQASEILKTS